jgi:hypothetical protein
MLTFFFRSSSVSWALVFLGGLRGGVTMKGMVLCCLRLTLVVRFVALGEVQHALVCVCFVWVLSNDNPIYNPFKIFCWSARKEKTP